MRIGVTGHMDLTLPTRQLVRQAIEKALEPYVSDGITGVSCIAAGADSIFAEVVLELGGALEAIIPAADYRERKVKPEHAATFDTLLRRAANVRIMPFETASRDTYEAANDALITSSDRLFAVWDGRSPADKGGTAAVVQFAQDEGIPVEIIWPEGAARVAPSHHDA